MQVHSHLAQTMTFSLNLMTDTQQESFLTGWGMITIPIKRVLTAVTLRA